MTEPIADMQSNILQSIDRAVRHGPDMRKPQFSDGYMEIVFGRFLGYFEVGQHHIVRDGVATLEERVCFVFEVCKELLPPRNALGRVPPYLVSVETTLGLYPGHRLFDTFQRMNFDGDASHMVQLLGEAFILCVSHRYDKRRAGTHTSIAASSGYLIHPAKFLDAATGKTRTMSVAPARSSPRAFVWETASLDDWYSIYVPGERNTDAGEIAAPARSKNVIQERIMRANNWSQHPLAAVVTLGGSPHAHDTETEDGRISRIRAEFKANIEAICGGSPKRRHT